MPLSIDGYTISQPRVVIPKLAIAVTKEEAKRELKKAMSPTSKYNKQIYNNNAEWHSLNKQMNCMICEGSVGVSLVNHYVNSHPNSEVYPSRVTPDVGAFLRNFKDDHQCKKSMSAHKRFVYRQFCYFCNESMCFAKSNWIEHISRHTGYYRYKCTGCSKKFVTNAQHACEGECNVEKISQPYFEGINIVAYLCNLCNYIRFDESEIVKHLTCEHEAGAMKTFKKVLFLTFEESERKSNAVNMKNPNEEGIFEASRGKLFNFTSQLYYSK